MKYKLSILIISLLFTGCGMNVKVSGEVKVKFDRLSLYIESFCNYDQECIREELEQFYAN